MPDGSSKQQPAEDLSTDPARLAPSVEAILLSVDRPLPAGVIAQGLAPAPRRKHDDEEAEPGPADPKLEHAVKAAVEILNSDYAKSGRSFRIEAVAGGFRLMTLPEHAPAVAAFHRSRQTARLSKSAIETLAIVAYKQPITRAELEAIRGVACGEVLKTLVDKRLVSIRGRAEELGRPLLYGTSKQFLDAFGLSSLNDLPSLAELKLVPARKSPGVPPAEPVIPQAASVEPA